MKKCYIITFDLRNPGLNQELVATAIKSYGSWARLSSNSYLLSSFSTSVQIRDHILQSMYQGDKIYIGHLQREAAWYGLGDEIATWVGNNQT